MAITIEHEGFESTVQFRDGLVGVIDLSGLITSDDAGVFSVLRDQNFFNQAYLNHGAVTWPGDLDLAPDAMYENIKNQAQTKTGL